MTRRHPTVIAPIARARRLALIWVVGALTISLAAAALSPSAQLLPVLLGAGALIIQTVIALVYWTGVRIRLAHGRERRAMRAQILLLYALGTFALLLYPLLLTLTFIGTPRGPLPTTGILVGGSLFVIACAVYIHVFLVKLIRSGDDQRARERRRQVDARLMRELSRAERRADRGRA